MKKKKVLMAFSMLLLTGVALSTATYAWFTANTKLELGELDVNVQATNGIQVSTDAINWKSILTTEEIKAATYTGSQNQFPTTLTPVSTIGSTTAGIFDMYYGSLQDDGSIELSKETDAQGTDGKYVAFDLFISSTAEKEIALLDTSKVVATGEKDSKLQYSARVGFLNKGTDATSTPESAYLLNSKVSQTIWQPNADQHTTIAINNSGAVAGEIPTYLGAKAATTDGSVAINASTHFGTLSATLINTKVTETEWPDTTVITVGAGITKLRIYVWIEGQDIDCENTASLGTGIKININLNAK